jgi:hypothetical protein
MEAIFDALAFNIWTFLFQTVNVLVVLGGLYLILWKPLNKTLQPEEKKLKGISGKRLLPEKRQTSFWPLTSNN